MWALFEQRISPWPFRGGNRRKSEKNVVEMIWERGFFTFREAILMMPALAH